MSKLAGVAELRLALLFPFAAHHSPHSVSVSSTWESTLHSLAASQKPPALQELQEPQEQTDNEPHLQSQYILSRQKDNNTLLGFQSELRFPLVHLRFLRYVVLLSVLLQLP